MTKAPIAGILAAAFVASVVIVAAGQHVPLTDRAIRAQVEHRLVEEDIRGVAVAVRARTVTLSGTIQVDPPIHVVVRHGRVTLTGVVLSEVERRKAEVIARSVFGVFSVENKLRLEGDEQ